MSEFHQNVTDEISISLTNQRGEEFRGGAPSCHEGCPGNILTELEVLLELIENILRCQIYINFLTHFDL